MDKQALDEKKLSIQQQFDALSKQKGDIEVELARLQGEYRLVEDLLTKGDKKNGK